jgi:molecular chaperone HscB
MFENIILFFLMNRIKKLIRTISCSSCKKEVTKSGECNLCQVLTKKQTSPSYFTLLNTSSKYKIDEQALRKKFLLLQQQWHPDRYSQAPKEELKKAELKSMELNKAYQVLKDPLARSHYLLSLVQYDITEKTHLDDKEFLLEVMEIQEDILEADHLELETQASENKNRIDQSVSKLGDLFDKKLYNDAQKEAIRLNYWYTIEKLIHEKEFS